jgi:hypothetical protein
MKCLVTNVIVFIRFLVLGKYVKLGNLGFWSTIWTYKRFLLKVYWDFWDCDFQVKDFATMSLQIWWGEPKSSLGENIDQLPSELLLSIYLKSQATLLLKLSSNIQLCPTKACQVIECSTKTVIKNFWNSNS